jgi:hypothetical protein
MFAANVSDWSDCLRGPEFKDFEQKWWNGQWPFVPTSPEAVHFYRDPVILLKFFSRNIGHSLFDHLLTYLPHWYAFRSQNKFPFKAVIDHSMQGDCLTNNSGWYCQLLRAMDAFGGVPVYNTDSTVLNCYEKVLTVHLALPRTHGWGAEFMPNKTGFDEFRGILFNKLELPRPIYYLHNTTKAPIRKVLFYAHEPSGRRVWTNMNDLISNARAQSKYSKFFEFSTVYDFGSLTIKEQAQLFNTHDVMVMGEE